LVERMQAFSASPKALSRFCPHPSTWLNEGRYDDDPRTWLRGDDRNDPRGTGAALLGFLGESNGH
jgi:hypothetical protein